MLPSTRHISNASLVQSLAPIQDHRNMPPITPIRRTGTFPLSDRDGPPLQHRRSSPSAPQETARMLSTGRAPRTPSNSVKANKMFPTRLDQPLPDPPPVEIPAPLRPRRASTMTTTGSLRTTPLEKLPNLPEHPSSTRGSVAYEATATSGKPQRLDTSPSRGFSERERVKNALLSKQLTKLQIEATIFSRRPLSATPDSAAPTPQEVWQPHHRQRRSASSDKVSPLSASPNVHAPLVRPSPDATVKITIPQTPLPKTDLASLSRLADLRPDSTAFSPDSDQSDPTTRLARALGLRSVSVTTLEPPEQSAWRRTSYIAGSIKLQRPRSLLNAPLSPFDLGKFTFNSDLAATTVDDIFKKILDDASSTHTKRSEDTTLSDVAQYMETYGFEPVTFSGDEFWLDDETRSIRSRITSMASAELSFHYNHHAHSQSPSVSSPGTRTSSGMPERRLSNNGCPVPRHSSVQSVSSSRSLISARYLPSSPATLQSLGWQDSMTERERRVALKKMGASSQGTSHRVGFRRLLRGAGGIV